MNYNVEFIALEDSGILLSNVIEVEFGRIVGFQNKLR
jgi:hypothetical protein